MGSRDLVAGIHLGASSCTLAVYDRRSGRITAVSEPSSGLQVIPNCIAFDQTNTVGKLLYGSAAKAHQSIEPKNCVYNIKRILGKSYHHADVADQKNSVYYTILNKNGSPVVQIEENGAPVYYSPEEIIGIMLSYLKHIAEKTFSAKIFGVVVTVPANFSIAQRQAMKKAAELAGLTVIQILNEPLAAALGYWRDIRDTRNVLVFDFGAQTLYASVVEVDESREFRIRATACNQHLGGDDIDLCLVQHLVQVIKDSYYTDVSTNAKALFRLRNECESIKKNLSFTSKKLLMLKEIAEDHDLISNFTRQELETLCSSLFGRIIHPVQRALTTSGLQSTDISNIIVVGGGSRIPKVKELLEHHFPCAKLLMTIDPCQVVAVGAAELGGFLCFDESDLNFEIDGVTLAPSSFPKTSQCTAKYSSVNLKPQVLKKVDYRARKHETYLAKLIQAEKSHVEHLTALRENFYQPILSCQLVPLDILNQIFPNIEEIIFLHAEFSRNLQKSATDIASLTAGDALASRFNGQNGKEFQRAVSAFCQHQRKGFASLTDDRNTSTVLTRQLQICAERLLCWNLTLEDITSVEVKILAKYSIFIKKLMKYCNVHDTLEKERFSCALTECETILSSVQQPLNSMDETWNQSRLKHVLAKMDTAPFIERCKKLNLSQLSNLQDRCLLFSGDLTWRLPSKIVNLHVLLLDSMIWLVTKVDGKLVLKFHSPSRSGYNKSFRRSLPAETWNPVLSLDSIHVKSNALDSLAFFLLINVTQADAKMYEMLAATASEQTEWVKRITEAVAKVFKTKDVSVKAESSKYLPEKPSTETEDKLDTVENSAVVQKPSHRDLQSLQSFSRQSPASNLRSSKSFSAFKGSVLTKIRGLIQPGSNITETFGCSWQYSYRQSDYIGRGAFGIVYKAKITTASSTKEFLRNRSTKQNLLAVKVTHLHKEAELVVNPERYKKLQRQFSILVHLKHKNLAAYHKITVRNSDGGSFVELLMDYYPEGDMAALLETIKSNHSSLDPSSAIRFALEISLGLDFLHKKGIIHGDLKTENVLVKRSKSGRKKLLISDFDDLVPMQRSVTCSGDMTHTRGTIRYMSPEMLKNYLGWPTVSPGRKTDVWSLGCIMLDLGSSVTREYKKWLQRSSADELVESGDKLSNWQYCTLILDGYAPLIIKSFPEKLIQCVQKSLCHVSGNRASAEELVDLLTAEKLLILYFEVESLESHIPVTGDTSILSCKPYSVRLVYPFMFNHSQKILQQFPLPEELRKESFCSFISIYDSKIACQLQNSKSGKLEIIVWDTNRHSWRSVCLQDSLGYMSVPVAVKDKIFFWDSSCQADGRLLLKAVDFKTQTIAEMALIPHAKEIWRIDCGARLGHKIVYTGSRRFDHTGFTGLVLICFNTLTNGWETAFPELPETIRRRSYAVSVLHDNIYVLGGFSSSSKLPLSSCVRLNLLSGKWEEISDLCRPRFGHSAFVLNHCIYVLGGRHSAEETLSDAEVLSLLTNQNAACSGEIYDPESDKWSEFAIPAPDYENKQFSFYSAIKL
ncbi:uncharacterized protein LOC129596103 [Paramacrobiotus metropolitanus]|uniref:uncharacterized protein LOC129596103 n=1 Tax=Paramacrobiotus metropolitanus TaxID=2943436 RepID=UPI002446579B|nr:uncharacterized protein LOC129596103 [Paramacrobiotus metropolitanus]